MKILHLIHKSQNRGAETFACQLAGHQLKNGNDVKIIAIYPGNADLPWFDTIENLHGKEKSFMDWKAWRNLAMEIKKFQPDIIQTNSGDTLKYAVFSKKLFGWKNPIIFRNASQVGRYLKSPLQKRLNSFFYKHVEFVISVSRASEKDIINHFPFLSGKTKVIPVGLEPVSNIIQIDLKPYNSRHIIHVGGFTFEKNHFGLLKIFQSVLKSIPNVHLHLVGDGPLKAEIEQELKEKNLINNVTLYGFVSNPLSYIKAGDVLVLPSIIEGLPGTLLEAMMCKTPVVANNVGGISEIVTTKTGNLVEKNNEDEFVKAVLKTLKKPNNVQIGAAHEMVVKDFMNKEIAVKFLELYSLFSTNKDGMMLNKNQ